MASLRVGVKEHTKKRVCVQEVIAGRRLNGRENVLSVLRTMSSDNEVEIDEGGSAWIQKPTREERAILHAQKLVDKNETFRPPALSANRADYEVHYESQNDSVNLSQVSLLKVYSEIRTSVPTAQARVTSTGKLVITVKCVEELDKMKAFTSLGGLSVRIISDVGNLWGRISNVNPQFTDEDLLDCLQSQGISKLRRETYTASKTTADGPIKVVRNSHRVRVCFSGDPVPTVNIAGEIFCVTLCSVPPLQCLSCYKFGHKAATCSKKTSPICKRCSKPGHQMWHCIAEKPSCVNCGQSHSATDPRCNVYAVHAEASRQRLCSRVLTKIPNAVIEEVLPVSENSVSFTAGQSKLSFSDVVSSKKLQLVKKDALGSGSSIVCYMPSVPVNRRKQSKPIHLQSASKVSLDSKSSVFQNKDDNGSKKNLSEVVTLLTTLWAVAKPFMAILSDRYPEFMKFVEAIESSGLISKILSLLTSSQ